jgi:hypothetical protein
MRCLFRFSSRPNQSVESNGKIEISSKMSRRAGRSSFDSHFAANRLVLAAGWKIKVESFHHVPGSQIWNSVGFNLSSFRGEKKSAPNVPAS